jgi:hypothetical protein
VRYEGRPSSGTQVVFAPYEVIYSITGRKNEIWIGTQYSGLKRFEIQK